jgi:hypothetical protein
MRKRFAPEKDAGPIAPSVTCTRRKTRAILVYGGMSVKADIQALPALESNFLLLFTLPYIRNSPSTNVRLS